MEEKRYEMRFVPYDAEGKLKPRVPRVGGKHGLNDGDIALLTLEHRWEAWWELADEESVPEAELIRDQKERDIFMEEAKKAEEERAKQLLPVGVPIA